MDERLHRLLDWVLDQVAKEGEMWVMTHPSVIIELLRRLKLEVDDG